MSEYIDLGRPNIIPAPIIPPLCDMDNRTAKGLPLPDCPAHICITSTNYRIREPTDDGKYKRKRRGDIKVEIDTPTQE